MLKESCVERPVLTQKEREVLNFIREYWKKYQLYPSFREIGAGIGLRSASSVNRYIHSLTEKGEILPHKGKMRCLVLKERQESCKED